MQPGILKARLRDDLASSGTIHVFHVDLAAERHGEAIANAKQMLSPQECCRADAFLRQEPRANYIAGRSILRRLLGVYLGQPPAAVRIETSALGKPFLASPADAWLCFNVAHSGTRLLAAIGCERRIGIDIEQLRSDLDDAERVESYFAAEEQAALARLMPGARLPSLFACWTRKEAFVKATGNGLATPLDSFVVAVGQVESSALLKLDGDPAAAAGWTVRDVPVAPGYAAAVAAEGKISALKNFDYAGLAGAMLRGADPVADPPNEG